MAKIAFIGLGNMGLPMARNLLKNDHQLTVFDLNQEVVQQIASEGATSADSILDAVAEAEVVISMLPSGQIVEDIYVHKDKLLDNIYKNTLVIDCSTIAPGNARLVAEVARKEGIEMIDAPVSGGTAGAAAGTLTFICGGEGQAVEKARPYLECMGKNVFHAGSSGAGQVAKICNNMLLAIHMAGTAEALELGVKNGLDPKVLSDIMLQSSGRNWSLELYNPYPGVMDSVPSSNDYQGGFMVSLMQKDLGLAMEESKNSNAKTPMGELATSLYKELSEAGNSGLDFSSIQKLFS